jgi:hypothetical protein
MRGDLRPVAYSEAVFGIRPRVTNPLENHPAECTEAWAMRTVPVEASAAADLLGLTADDKGGGVRRIGGLRSGPPGSRSARTRHSTDTKSGALGRRLSV